MSAPLQWRIAIRDSGLDPTAKYVALTLETYMNGKGAAWPSRATLAANTGRSISTIDRALLRIEQAGYLKVKRSRGRGSNRYRAVIPNSRTRAAVAEELTAALVLTQRLHQCVSNSRTHAARSSKEAAIELGESDHLRDQNLALAHGWLQMHPARP